MLWTKNSLKGHRAQNYATSFSEASRGPASRQKATQQSTKPTTLGLRSGAKREPMSANALSATPKSQNVLLSIIAVAVSVTAAASVLVAHRRCLLLWLCQRHGILRSNQNSTELDCLCFESKDALVLEACGPQSSFLLPCVSYMQSDGIGLRKLDFRPYLAWLSDSRLLGPGWKLAS